MLLAVATFESRNTPSWFAWIRVVMRSPWATPLPVTSIG